MQKIAPYMTTHLEKVVSITEGVTAGSSRAARQCCMSPSKSGQLVRGGEWTTALGSVLLTIVLVCGGFLNVTSARAGSSPLQGLAGKCVDVTGANSADGTPLILWSCHGGPNQQWEVQQDGTIRGLDGKCLDAFGGKQDDGTPLILWSCHGGQNQRWEVRSDGTIRGVGEKCLDVAGANSADGSPLILWSCHGGPNQQWSGALQASPIFNSHLNDPGKPLRGFVDLHTHPMAHLGFGGHVVFGAPDDGVQMMPDAIYNDKEIGPWPLKGKTCNETQWAANGISEALGDSYSAHGGKDWLKNKCGNDARKLILSKMGEKFGSNIISIDHPEGYPSFRHWPAYNDILHQQMWWEWIKRAKEGGLRVMVALAVNNFTLATVLQPNGETLIDDQKVGNLQIEELKTFVGKHQDFMQIANSPQDLRRIIESDKLAIVIGIELDDIGNMLKISPTPDMVRQEIRRLYDLGVRYAFPVHIIDNHFGGTAAYETEFALANRFQAGHWLDLTCSGGEGITKRIKFDEAPIEQLNEILKLIPGIGGQSVPNCAPGEGFKNTRGLTSLGRVVLDEMMSLGMIIDIDHMSQQTANDTIQHTGGTGSTATDRYPIVSGHNALRVPYNSHSVSFNDHDSENQRTTDQYREIAARGGIAGVGFGKSNARTFIEEANAVIALGVPVNFGSDINGLVSMPQTPKCQTDPCIQYSASFPPARMGEKVWDYNRDGVAHIGLFPDFLKHVENLPGGPPLVDKLYNGAEAFAKMWEKAGQVSQRIRSSVPSSTPQQGGSSGTGGRVDPDDQPLPEGRHRR